MRIDHLKLIDLCSDYEPLMARFTAYLADARLAASHKRSMQPPEGVVDAAFEGFLLLYDHAIEKLRNVVSEVENALGTSIFVDVPKNERLDELLGYMGWITYPLEDDPRRHLTSNEIRRMRRAAA